MFEFTNILSSFVTRYNEPMDPTPCWYAVYTKSRHEKKLAGKLNEKGIEAYIPLRKTLKQWSDRKKAVEEVLIRSYVFVKILPTQYDTVLGYPGAVRFIWFSGKPAVIPDRQIALLKLVTGTGTEVTAVPCNLKPGTPVRVIAGPLQGLTGELIINAKGNNVVLRIDHVTTALMLTISPNLLERVTSDK
jgi:transcriptional antiterminator RfaH